MSGRGGALPAIRSVANEVLLPLPMWDVLLVRVPIADLEPVAGLGPLGPPGASAGDNTSAPCPAGEMAADTDSPTSEDIRETLDLWSSFIEKRAEVTSVVGSIAAVFGNGIW